MLGMEQSVKAQREKDEDKKNLKELIMAEELK